MHSRRYSRVRPMRVVKDKGTIMSGKKKGRTIFRVLMLPLFCILAAELCVLAGSLLFGGVISKLEQNSRDILAQQVENRGNYLVNEMIGNWSSLGIISSQIDAVVREHLEQEKITVSDLTGEACGQLLAQLQPELIRTMYNKQATGIFLILNTKELAGEELPDAFPGIYLRDFDPLSTRSEQNEDILAERAPVEAVRAGRIATDIGWQPVFSREECEEQPFFYQPFTAAYADGGKLPAKEYGYWTTEPYTLAGDKHRAVAYSVPLMLEDGTVYGVLGVELLVNYMQSLLPCGELLEEGQGCYLLAVAKEGERTVSPVLFSGESMLTQRLADLEFSLEGTDDREANDASGKYYGAVKPLILYSNHAPFESDRWYLLGIGAKEDLFAFSRQIQAILFVSFVLTIGIGFIGILLVSYRLSKPIRRLSNEVELAKKSSLLPTLSETGIQEIDQFADAIIRLQREVTDSSIRFLQIIHMASVDIAGYEVRDGAERVFVTANYFPMLGAEAVDTEKLTPEEFWDLSRHARQNLRCTASDESGTVYEVPVAQDKVRYLHFEDITDGDRHVGLVEDVTAATLERMRVEHERDCDGLTKLYSRRGFRREAEALFLQPERLRQAGLLMIDLDNLKSTNDKYGHNFGDRYIQTAAKCFSEHTPERTLCARISGDEFLLLFYGYESQEQIKAKLDELYRAIREVKFDFPDGTSMRLSASGGVAWYPADGKDLSELMKYADFAMYQVKCSQKGALKVFDREAYQCRMEQNQIKMEFHRLLDSGQFTYHFQPIFHGMTGEVYAYEALMRVSCPTLRSPETVLKLAKEEGRMHEVESLTLFRASARYCDLLEQGKVSEGALLFINSIANERMTEAEQQQYHQRFSHIQSRVVVEITEAEHLDMEMIQKKSETEGFSGMFALDDYGSGYNSEINLLELNPAFVKVDITIVRDIDKDANKQQIVANIVEYAHKRDMMVIAEGLETPEEVLMSLKLGVDLLQGYFLARPGEIPPEISAEAYRLIQELGKK